MQISAIVLQYSPSPQYLGCVGDIPVEGANVDKTALSFKA